MELPPQGDKLHKSSDHLEKEDVELYSVGTRDTLASHDGVLLSCASHANKVPKLAQPPPSPLPAPPGLPVPTRHSAVVSVTMPLGPGRRELFWSLPAKTSGGLQWPPGLGAGGCWGALRLIPSLEESRWGEGSP